MSVIWYLQLSVLTTKYNGVGNLVFTVDRLVGNLVFTVDRLGHQVPAHTGRCLWVILCLQFTVLTTRHGGVDHFVNSNSWPSICISWYAC